MTCKWHCSEHFYIKRISAAATLRHAASEGDVLFACFPLDHVRPRRRWPANHRELDAVLFFLLLFKWDQVSYCEENKRIRAVRSNEARVWPRSRRQSESFRRHRNKSPGQKVSCNHALQNHSPPAPPSLSTLLWLANECRWRSGGGGGLIAGVMCACREPRARRAPVGRRWKVQLLRWSPHLNKQKG